MHLFNMRHHGGAVRTSKLTYLTLRKIFRQVEKSKVKISVYFIVGIFSKIKFYEHFVLLNFLTGRSPEALRARQHP